MRTFHLHGQDIDLLKEVETHAKTRIRGCKKLEAVKVYQAKEPEEDEGEELGDLAGMQPMALETSFSAVDSNDPQADDISVFQQDSQFPPAIPVQKGPRAATRSYSKQTGTPTTTMNPEKHRVTWSIGSKMGKDSRPGLGEEVSGKKGQDGKVNEERQLCQLEIGELFKRAPTHVPSLG